MTQNYIYIFISHALVLSALTQSGQPPEGSNIQVDHIFACELDQQKRELLCKQHAVKHCFENVDVFHHKWGFCHICQKEHEVSRATIGCDIFYCGPSCKDLSKLNNERVSFAGCYSTPHDESAGGSSGVTYQYGFREAFRIVYYVFLFAVANNYIVYIYIGFSLQRGCQRLPYGILMYM